MGRHLQQLSFKLSWAPSGGRRGCSESRLFDTSPARAALVQGVEGVSSCEHVVLFCAVRFYEALRSINMFINTENQVGILRNTGAVSTTDYKRL